jgi:hypothetical protein
LKLSSPIAESGKAQLRLTIKSVEEPKRNFAMDSSETPTSFKDVAEQFTAELDAMTVSKNQEFGYVDSQSEDYGFGDPVAILPKENAVDQSPPSQRPFDPSGEMYAIQGHLTVTTSVRGC